MVTVVIIGIGIVMLVALIVSLMDAAQASAWRQVATERRDLWRSRHFGGPHRRR